MICDSIVLFILLIIFILIICNIYYGHAGVATLISGGLIKSLVSDSENVKDVLIVDVANIYVGWYMEKYNKPLPYTDQQKLLLSYIDCMSDHYERFTSKNNVKTGSVNYIIKNYKTSGKKMFAPKIPDLIWEKLHEFIGTRHNAYITVAEDYKTFPISKWKKPSFHYLRGRDDFLCFYMARKYKKQYIDSYIMSDDKYYDFKYFGQVPLFTATHICKKKNKTIQSSETIKPKPNSLGQINDYKLIKTTVDFVFDDPKFLKVSNYKIAEPGHVWK